MPPRMLFLLKPCLFRRVFKARLRGINTVKASWVEFIITTVHRLQELDLKLRRRYPADMESTEVVSVKIMRCKDVPSCDCMNHTLAVWEWELQAAESQNNNGSDQRARVSISHLQLELKASTSIVVLITKPADGTKCLCVLGAMTDCPGYTGSVNQWVDWREIDGSLIESQVANSNNKFCHTKQKEHGNTSLWHFTDQSITELIKNCDVQKVKAAAPREHQIFVILSSQGPVCSRSLSKYSARRWIEC